MRTKSITVKKLLSLVMAIAMMATMILPTNVFALDASTISTDLDEKTIITGKAVEFTVSSVANSDAGTMVRGKFEVEAGENDIAKLEYYETAVEIEGWRELPTEYADGVLSGEFGPVNGFSMMDATSTFRVTFANAGTYPVKVSEVTVDGGEELCSEEVQVKVAEPVAGTISTNLDEQRIVIENDVDFTVSTVANDDAETLVRCKFEVEAGENDIAKLEYYETAAEIEGWRELPTEYADGVLSGDFGPVNGFPMMDATSKFRVTFANAGTYPVKVSAVKMSDGSTLCEESVDVTVIGYADYTELETAVANAKTYKAENYTAASYKVLEKAVAEAEAVSKTIAADKQLEVDVYTKAIKDAVAALVEAKEVTFTAVAVADDVTVDYAKANKIVLVFGEPIKAGSDVLSKLNIKDDVTKAEWKSNTVYILTLDAEHELKNDATITFDGDDTIFTELGAAMKDTEAVVAGNLEEAYENVTATQMAATIVKNSDKVGVVEGDKIVLVFNAPVYKTPDEIIVNDMTAKVVADTYNTVYEIELTGKENITDATVLAYGNIKATLDGTFGTAVAPKLLSVVAIDNDGTAKVSGDEIVVTFDRPTNGAAVDLTKAGILTGVTGAALGTKSKAVWSENNTKLTITLGDDAVAANGVKLNLAGQGIMDKDSIVDAVIAETEVGGSFGTVTAPVALKAYAVDVDGSELVYNDIDKDNIKKDQIVIVFDTPTNGVAVNISKIKAVGTGYSANIGTEATALWEDDNTKLVITLGKDSVIKNGVTIDLSDLGIMDKDSIIDADAATLKLEVEGSFGFTIQPRITRAVAFTQNNIDYIRVFFNTEVAAKTGETIEVSISPEFTMGASAKMNLVDQNNGLTYYEIAMAKDEHDALESGKFAISLTGIVDKYTKAKDLANTSGNITGAFITPIKPEVLDIIALSKDGSGVAKKGDEILVIFNTEVTGGNITLLNNGLGDGYEEKLEGNVLKITLGEGPTVKVGDKIRVADYVDAATKASKIDSKEIAIDGTFGKITEPKALSITAISKDGSGVAKKGDEIVTVFNTEVIVTKLNGTPVTEAKGSVYTYVLTEDGQYKVGDPYVLTVTSVDTGITYELKTVGKENADAVIGGSFGNKVDPVVKSAVLSESDGKEVITVIFDRAVKVDKDLTNRTEFKNQNSALDIKGASWDTTNTVLTIELGTNTKATSSDTLNLSGLGIKAADTDIDVPNLEKLAIKGSLVPVVESVEADGKNINIKFSTRTNGVANISHLTSLFGVGAKATWSDNNRLLTIALGENYTLTTDSYIVINGMGIRDGFSGTHQLVGQYRISSGSIDTDALMVTKIVAQSDDKSTDVPHAGDRIVIKFNSATNINGASLNVIDKNIDRIVSVEGGNEKAFGTGYTAQWTDYDTLTIILGGATESVGENGETIVTGLNPDIAVGSDITVSGVAFANGKGTMDKKTLALGGSFNGREFVFTAGGITRTSENSGDYRVSVTVENVKNTGITPAIVCVAYNGDTPVSVMRLSNDIENKATAVFEFAESLNVTKAKIYVFNDIFGKMDEIPDVLAETLEVE